MKRVFDRRTVRWVALLTALCLLLSAAACREKKPDDKELTEALVQRYLNAFTGCDVGKMNQYSLTKLEPYTDSDEIDETCRLLTARTAFTVESINVSGSSAIAQVSITMPHDFGGVCRDALEDALQQMEQDSERLPSEILNGAIKNHAAKAERTSATLEISLSKVNNKWYIMKSQDIADLLSDIRTSVAAVYSVMEDAPTAG